MTELAERSYAHMDKAGWERGPWDDEPDKIQWVDETTGLDCLIVRNRMGALCGYVGVPPEHPWHGRSYSGSGWDDPNRPDSSIDVHGGLTYSDSCDEGASEEKGICHVPAPGRPKDVWWFGFDCGHMMDVAPAMEAREREMGFAPIRDGLARYRTVEYVKGECASLARQLVVAS